MHGMMMVASALGLRCVRSDELSLCNNGKFNPLYCKYKTVKDVEKPAGIITPGVELLCKILQKSAHPFEWANGGSFSFFLQTHKEIISSHIQITKLWKELKDLINAGHTWFHAQMCLLGVLMMTNHVWGPNFPQRKL